MPDASGQPSGSPRTVSWRRSVAAGGAGDGWARLIPESDPVDWLPRHLRRPSFGIVAVVGGFVEVAIVIALVVAYTPFRLVTGLIDQWGLLFIGPVVGLAVALLTTPIGLGVGPRGITLAFPLGRLFVPWNFLFPGIDEASRCELGYIDPRSMKSATTVLGLLEARGILEDPFSLRWSRLSAAAKAWKERVS